MRRCHTALTLTLPQKERGEKSVCRCWCQLIQRHFGFDLLIPAAHTQVDHESIGASVLTVSRAAPRALCGALRLNGLAGLVHIIDVKADVMHPLHRRRPLAKIWGILATIFEDREIDVAIAQPDPVGASILGSAMQLLQAKNSLVKLGGFRGIIG